MHVVAHGVAVCQASKERNIAALHVEEAHGVGTFTGGELGERLGLRILSVAGADGGFYPWKKIMQAASGIVRSDVACVAIILLPHLVEAMDRVSGVVVIINGRRDLVRASRQIVDVVQARI